MHLNTYSPEMFGTVLEVIEDSYPKIVERSTSLFAGAHDKVKICGLPVCHIASRVVTEGLLATGIAAYREDHRGHFITVLPDYQAQASETDTIICLTWAQWAVFLDQEVTVEKVVEQHTSLERPGYFGTREGIQPMVPVDTYEYDYACDSVLSRAGAYNLKELDPPVEGFEYEWDMSSGVYQVVTR